MFERAGIAAHIVDPSALQVREDGLYSNDQRVDLIYNRLTDFDLKQHLQIRSAWEKKQVVLTPNPAHYQRYADKRKLVLFSDAEWLRSAGVSQTSIDVLSQCVPQTRLVQAQDAEQWWAVRKQWFFKPVSGYGGKGAYRGEKLTKRVFEEIMQSDYVGQRLALPGERKICFQDTEPQSLKYDVRCFVYDGHIQLIAARLYQGQTTNFRTPGGGFALVREVC
jgi:glutathione synthase/RimK-type ligase-like ATP-grasp enzyme